MDSQIIYGLAQEFRGLVEVALRDGLETKCHIDEHFPNACCEDASVLLATFLADNGFDGSLLVYGVHGGVNEELRTHVWLLLNGLHIDITGSQFSKHGYDQPEVYVAKKCDFLESFHVEKAPRQADFRVKYSEKSDWLYWFESTYRKIISKRTNPAQ